MAPVVPAAARRAGKDTLARAERQAIRVDEVGSTMIVAAQSTSSETKPRTVERTRLSGARASLAPREAFLLSLLDRARTVPDLAAAARMTEHEVMKIVARLVRLGCVSLGGP